MSGSLPLSRMPLPAWESLCTPCPDPQKGWPKLPLWIHEPLAGEPRLSPSSSHSLQPPSPPPTPEGPVQTHTPVQSMCREGRGQEGTCSCNGSRNTRTDLETPVVWLLMEIREDMVTWGAGRGEQGRRWVRDPLSSALSPGTRALCPPRNNKKAAPGTSCPPLRRRPALGRLQAHWRGQGRAIADVHKPRILVTVTQRITGRKGAEDHDIGNPRDTGIDEVELRGQRSGVWL